MASVKTGQICGIGINGWRSGRCVRVDSGNVAGIDSGVAGRTDEFAQKAFLAGSMVEQAVAKRGVIY